MPITKTDIQNLGNTLKDTLTVWGEQIQYGRDIATLKKIQNRLSNMRSLTTNSDGTSKSREDIAKSLFQVQTDIESNIRTPGIMSLANQTVGQFFNEALKSAQQKEQTNFNIGMSNIESPSTAVDVNNLTSKLNPSLYQFKGPGADKLFAPKLVTIQHVGEDGVVDNDNFDIYLSGVTQRGKPYKIFQGTKHRDKLSPEEELGIVDKKLANALQVAKLNQSNFNYSVSKNITPGPQSFTDSNGKVINTVFRDGKYYNPDNPKEQISVQGLIPITENVNPNKKNSFDGLSTYEKVKTASDMLDKIIPSKIRDEVNALDISRETIVQDIMNMGTNSRYWNMIPQFMQQELMKSGLIGTGQY